jgi:hypothetical protein
MAKQNKYEYVKVIQVHGAYGWEDVSEYYEPKNREERKAIYGDLREYNASGTGAHRLISRRNLIKPEAQC